ncbi:hypothetical protein MA16_Dca012874 [Dendrobium catenatum]|uniref:Uncharacterized protein n=1 Tax=Dendrobium catenatum TaxID=906689 RepID=A0A2I0VXS2_9ASPA|nr:hypothetical protein MA16_Dca012874 [Dendrobium catenatum]
MGRGWGRGKEGRCGWRVERGLVDSEGGFIVAGSLRWGFGEGIRRLGGKGDGKKETKENDKTNHEPGRLQETEYGLTFDEDGFTDILQSTFFDVNTRIDHTVDDNRERILEAINEHFEGVEWRISTAP